MNNKEVELSIKLVREYLEECWDTSTAFKCEGIGKAKEDLNNPLRPLESFECEICGYKWLNPQFEKYLAVMVGIF